MTENIPTLAALLRYFMWLGTVGFGGPVVLVERMRADLEEARHWYTPAEYKEGLALAQLAPGPLAAQLAIYLGWVRAGLLGATLVGIAFVGPSFIMVLMLSAAYVRVGGLPWMHGAFYGVGAAVIAVISHSAFRLVKKTVGVDRLLWAIVIVNAVMTATTEREIVWVIVASGVLVLAWRQLARRRNVVACVAIIPSWLVDAVAVSMITPGPVVITVAFIGYLVAGPLGACAAAIGVFVPVYLAVVIVARWFHRVAKNRPLRAMIDGITAAATGAIAGAVFVLGHRALTDVATWAIFVATLALVLWAKRISQPVLILSAGLVGIPLGR